MHSNAVGVPLMRGGRTASDGTFSSSTAFEFVDIGFELEGAAVQPLDLRQGGHVGDELAGVPDVDEAVLGAWRRPRAAGTTARSGARTGAVAPDDREEGDGARLPTPSVDRVLTQAMGRGMTLPMSTL
ncbi:hypothetical protein [Streptomyces sp. NPDC005760]|uniref:hypothetical protein n=1 Tax=Streptomyces sp. NPDC005760 TaxID=3156718 RepID=UPI0033CBF16E